MSDAPTEQRDIRAYLGPVLKRWWLILAVVPLVTVGTYLYYDHKPKVYQSSAELYVQPSALDQLLLGKSHESAFNVENFALLIETSAVADRADEKLANEGGKGASQIPVGSVEAAAIEQSSFIVLNSVATTPQGAARLANAYAAAFAEMQTRQVRGEAKRAVRTAEAQLRNLGTGLGTVHRREAIEQQIQNLQLIASQPDANTGIKVVQPATPDPTPIEHDPGGNAIFGFVVGLMLAVGAAYGLEYLNRKITRVEDVEGIYELPVLSEIPQVDVPAPLEGQDVAMAKMLHGPFHRLQTNLEMLARERPMRTIVVASAAPEEGKSVVTRNLALAYREAGHNVVVLDADFRKPSLEGLLAAREGLGLSDILAGGASFGEAVQEVAVQTHSNGNGASPRGAATGVASPPANRGGELAMVPAGKHRDNLSLGLSSDQMRRTLTIAADTYGTAIIDSPPLLAVADGLPLLSEADAVVLVMRMGVSTRDSARRLLRELKRVPNVFVAGVVVSGIPPRIYKARSYGYYYG